LDSITNSPNIFILSHHPIQNMATQEEDNLKKLINTYTDKRFYWFCGDAHRNRAEGKDYIRLYQVGSITGESETMPDFAIYDIDEAKVNRRVFRYLPHLNSTSKMPGGWKRVFIDENAVGI
jgi:hypothetical protein